MRCILSFLAFLSLAFGQTFAVKDRNGAPAVLISDMTVSPELHGSVKNVSGENLSAVLITITVHMTGGKTVVLSLNSLRSRFAKDEVHPFSERWPPDSPADIASVEFRLESAIHVITTEGFHFSGFIAKDEGCLKDYLSTKLLAGVVPGEKLKELVGCDCGSVLEKPLAVAISGQKGLWIGANEVLADNVVLYDETLNADAMWRILATEYARLHPGSSARFKLGWVLMSELVLGPVLTIEQLGLGPRPAANKLTQEKMTRPARRN